MLDCHRSTPHLPPSVLIFIKAGFAGLNKQREKKAEIRSGSNIELEKGKEKPSKSRVLHEGQTLVKDVAIFITR